MTVPHIEQRERDLSPELREIMIFMMRRIIRYYGVTPLPAVDTNPDDWKNFHFETVWQHVEQMLSLANDCHAQCPRLFALSSIEGLKDTIFYHDLAEFVAGVYAAIDCLQEAPWQIHFTHDQAMTVTDGLLKQPPGMYRMILAEEPSAQYGFEDWRSACLLSGVLDLDTQTVMQIWVSDVTHQDTCSIKRDEYEWNYLIRFMEVIVQAGFCTQEEKKYMLSCIHDYEKKATLEGVLAKYLDKAQKIYAGAACVTQEDQLSELQAAFRCVCSMLQQESGYLDTTNALDEWFLFHRRILADCNRLLPQRLPMHDQHWAA